VKTPKRNLKYFTKVPTNPIEETPHLGLSMTSGIFASISGIVSSLWRHAVTSHNVANAGTPGYKARRPVVRENRAGGVDGARALRTDSQGPLIHTGRPLDLAIDGEGFFRLERDDGTVAYSRCCSLIIDTKGKLSTPSGFRTVPTITVPLNASRLMISPNGEVRATIDGKTWTLGQIEIATFRNPSGLIAIGDNLLVQSPASGPPASGPPGSPGTGILVQESLEGSNVDLATEFVMDLLASVHFKANINCLKTQSEMLGTILNIKT